MPELGTAQRGAAVAGSPAAPVEIELVHTEQDARAAVGVLAEVWPRADGKEPLPPELAWVFAHSGNYVAVARLDGVPVGAAIGFRGADHAGPLLHSHITGVLPRCQGAHVGYALKQHQRRWALGNGLDRVTWTFDPLVARNAYFNVMKLGARITSYFIDFYGPMDDGINVGDETDRCLAEWNLEGAAAVAAAAGESLALDVDTLAADGEHVVLHPDANGEPVERPAGGDVRLVRLPPDVVSLRHHEPALARAWRLALRAALVDAFGAGLAVVGVTRDATYLLSRPDRRFA